MFVLSVSKVNFNVNGYKGRYSVPVYRYNISVQNIATLICTDFLYANSYLNTYERAHSHAHRWRDWTHRNIILDCFSRSLPKNTKNNAKLQRSDGSSDRFSAWCNCECSSFVEAWKPQEVLHLNVWENPRGKLWRHIRVKWFLILKKKLCMKS